MSGLQCRQGRCADVDPEVLRYYPLTTSAPDEKFPKKFISQSRLNFLEIFLK
jgi:hypothetical protein